MLISGENILRREWQGRKIQGMLGVCEEVGSMWDPGLGIRACGRKDGKYRGWWAMTGTRLCAWRALWTTGKPVSSSQGDM